MDSQAVQGGKREFFPQLTSVRFFAAFVVVLYHYHKELTPHLPEFIQNFIIHGYVGVSFFFLLSGFILGANYYDRLLNKSVSKKDFWWARFSRIYPVYLISILIFVPRFFLPAGMDPIPEQAAYAHEHPLNVFVVSLFGLQTFATPGGAFLNSPTWSISTELFFYLLLPFLIPILNKVKSNSLIPMMIVLFLLAGIGPYLYHGFIFSEGLSKMGVRYTSDLDVFLNQFVRMSFVTRLPEFLIGVLSFRFYREVLSQGKSRWFLALLAIGSLPILYTIFFETDKGILNTVLYSGQFSCIPLFLLAILTLVVSKSGVIKPLQSKTWVLLGEASFSLYLFHIPIKHAGQYGLGKVLHMDKDNPLLALFLILASVLISIPIFLYLETPARKGLALWWKNRKSQSASA